MLAPDRVHFVAIEGVFGSGKTLLAQKLAERWDAHLMLERHEDNPFLERFYADQSDHALQTQLYFLLERHKRLGTKFMQRDLFQQVILSDSSFEKDRIYASLNLNDTEMSMYDTIARSLERDIVGRPDYIVFLQASTDTLIQRARKNTKSLARKVDPSYVEALVELYHQHFLRLSQCPVFFVNVDRIDFVNNPADFNDLATAIEQFPRGRHFYSPDSQS